MSKKQYSDTSPWTYFTKSSDKLYGICNVQGCKKPIKAVHGSSSGLRSHLSSHHGIKLEKQESSNEPSASASAPPPKIRKITTYFSTDTDRSLEAMISRMVALDGFAFEKYVTSQDLRVLFAYMGFTVPKCGKTIKKVVMDYYEKTKSAVIEQLKKKQAQGLKFSLSFDEWTSQRNRRFMNINVHCEIDFYFPHMKYGKVLVSLPENQIFFFAFFHVLGHFIPKKHV
jgi:hypothetical protein